ncbi:MAG: helix-turn-helix transcriptional regulator [Clostridia bacterium]|nr:helix-turn-helix transcriptional regulator [Clostridia bacterium]
MPYNSQITGRIIRDLRRQRGWSQEVLSGLAGIARSHLSEIENGEKNANVDTLWRIAEALGIRMSELMRRVEEESRPFAANK